MKLEGLALAAIMLAAMSTACASGATDAPAHGSRGATQNGSGGGGGGGGGGTSGAGGGDAGMYSYGTDTGSYTPPDSGTGVLPDTGTVFPTADSGLPIDASPTSCAATGTMSACAECCGSLNPTGVTTLNSAIQACACGATGTCSTECATEVCADIPATSGDTCFTCLSTTLASSGPCYTSVQTACTADPGCSAYLACESTACAGLP